MKKGFFKAIYHMSILLLIVSSINYIYLGTSTLSLWILNIVVFIMSSINIGLIEQKENEKSKTTKEAKEGIS